MVDHHFRDCITAALSSVGILLVNVKLHFKVGYPLRTQSYLNSFRVYFKTNGFSLCFGFDSHC